MRAPSVANIMQRVIRDVRQRRSVADQRVICSSASNCSRWDNSKSALDTSGKTRASMHRQRISLFQPVASLQVGRPCFHQMQEEDFWFYKTAPPLSPADADNFPVPILTVQLFFSIHVIPPRIAGNHVHYDLTTAAVSRWFLQSPRRQLPKASGDPVQHRPPPNFFPRISSC